ncbi:MAG: PEP/pyruvate-binding domain-containing protein [Thermodesulfobacteriota bacterium]|nr:PEP/pyruvate-binding domain-containing protein [Thermodesulfobacteriota bacterium]
MTITEKITAKSGVELLVEKRIMDDWVEISIGQKDYKKCLLHWGLCHHVQTPWKMPPISVWPEGSKAFGWQAIQTPFAEKDAAGGIVIRLDRKLDFSFLVFVLYFPEEERWDNNLGRNYRIPLAVPSENEVSLGHPELTVIADEIIEKEMSRNSWTLMHRFNLCYDLLDRVRNNMEGLALIFIWLRFSAIRQLDWQRNYNTQPRELSHAEDRLTLRLADQYTKEEPEGREYIRLMLTTMGRGGEGQRIRDEVLNIMHRLHIKEVSGHFMEEWHQKLHNNTTPDDVVICEAYLGFLNNNGNLDLFYKILEAGGITKERLESFERPIISHPDFVPSIKDPLIHELEHFLGILKAVHSGTDLGTAIYAARYLFDSGMHGLMDFIWAHRDTIDACMLIEKITEARRRLKTQLQGSSNVVRDLLFLDLALENFLRVVVERSLHLHLSADQLVELIAMVLDNLLISKGNDELTYCLHQWKHIRRMPHSGKDWALQSRAVLDRLTRALGAAIDHYYRVLQPKAEFLGEAFRAESWVISLFSEEVVRGKPIFALSMLLRQIDPILRRDAHLGSWQVIGQGQGTGQVEVVSDLRSVQGKDFARPTVIIADKVAGEEEIPKDVIAVITPDLTDIVSHVAIRARNANVLFAVCYDPDIIRRLKSFSGHLLSLSVNVAGDVIFKKGPGDPGITSQRVLPVPRISRPCFTAYAVSSSKFNQKTVGGKSNNLRHLQGRLPEWIGLPNSVAMPFGGFEKVLAEKNNKEIAANYNELVLRIDKNAEKVDREVLSELRKTILGLKAPDELVSELHGVMDEAGLPWPASWEDAWTCIKGVWGSKWNERAYLSRRTRGILHADLFMAVLIQEVVKADYSFVIHTVNPSTGNRDEIYAEVVPGLGETLVGNYPGKAFSFTSRKGKDEPQLLAFPSKSVAFFGSGLIFRSDSNGEDLAGYAGAGLYDSIMLEPSVKIAMDYTREALVGNEDFRKDFLITVANIGTVVEKAMGFPQDIEGAYSKGQYYVVQTRPQVGINLS